MSAAIRDRPGLKERELVALGDCAVCGKKLLEGGLPLFYVLEISRAGFEAGAIRRRAGLGVMMGNDALAQVFSADEDLAKVIDGPRRVVVHETCAGKIAHLVQLLEERA